MPVRAILLLVVALAACAQAPVQGPQDSVVPGTIGVAVRQRDSQVIVAAVGKGSPAASSGVQVGDVVLRYNGEAVNSARQFYRLVVDSPPGSVARLELLREGAIRTLEVPVGELDIMPRA
jgi:S1-C subfamily serine protease